MKLVIQPQGTLAIYEQIVNQLKNGIVTGALCAGEALPSIRGLAAELGVSVITTKRAYEELERDGFIVSVPGKGSFVAGKNLEFIREEHLRKIEELLQEAVALSGGCGLTLTDLQEMLELFYKEES